MALRVKHRNREDKEANRTIIGRHEKLIKRERRKRVYNKINKIVIRT